VGKQIVYCNACGSRLKEDDFARGRAHEVDFQSFCTRCRPAAAVAAPPAARPLARRPSSSSIPAQPRRPSSASIPAQPAPPPPLPASRRHVGWIAAAAAVAVLAAGSLFLFGGKEAPKAPPPEPSSPAPPGAADAGPMIALLEDLQSSSGDSSRVLRRCDELEPLVRGTRYEAKLREIRRRAQESELTVDAGRRLDFALAEARKLEDLDPRFQRRAEVKSLLEKARDSAGARRAEVEEALAHYEKRYDEAARAALGAAEEDAERLASASKFREAVARLDEVPSTFRAGPAGEALAARREDYLRRAADAERGGDRATAPWKDWKIVDCMGGPVFIEASGGRPFVLQTHPASPDVPAALERTWDVPPGKNHLSFWVSALNDGDWELRVVIDGTRVMADTIAPTDPRWREIQVDLAPYAGRKIALRLENAANGWNWEQGLWSGVEIRPGAVADWGARRKRQTETWAPWKVSSDRGAGMPVFLDSHEGRPDALRTHPFAKDKPAVLEREFALPAGKSAEFSIWVNHIAGSEWNLRILVGDKVLRAQTVAGGKGWTKVSVNLSPYAGTKATLRLENAAKNWNYDDAYWSSPELTLR
jgi:hypothetical protein